MEVPKYIKEAIYECAEFNKKANFSEKEIVKWMEKNKLTEETASTPERIMDDTFIDYCQMTNNPEKFIETLERL